MRPLHVLHQLRWIEGEEDVQVWRLDDDLPRLCRQ
jgi:hypothetical protein